MPRLRLIALLALTWALAGPVSAQANRVPLTGGLDLAGMDRTVQPGQDFWNYANGTWLKRPEIPPDLSYWGSDAILSEPTDKRTADLIQEIAKSDASRGTDRRKIGDF